MSIYGRLAGAAISLVLLVGAALSAYRESAVKAVTANESSEYYIIREYNGKVALFCDGTETPQAVFDVSIDQFSDADVALLRKGIRVKGVRDTARLIEDLELE